MHYGIFPISTKSPHFHSRSCITLTLPLSTSTPDESEIWQIHIHLTLPLPLSHVISTVCCSMRPKNRTHIFPECAKIALKNIHTPFLEYSLKWPSLTVRRQPNRYVMDNLVTRWQLLCLPDTVQFSATNYCGNGYIACTDTLTKVLISLDILLGANQISAKNPHC